MFSSTTGGCAQGRSDRGGGGYGGYIHPPPPNICGSVGNFLFHSVKISAVGKSRKRPFDACRVQRSYNTSLATISGIYEFNRLHRPRRPPRRIDQAPETTLVPDIHTHYRKEMISVLDRLATEFRDVQRSAESVAQPFACLLQRICKISDDDVANFSQIRMH